MFHGMRCSEHDHSSFYKLLQMEKNHKNNTDCYFFYYSTCTKGDSCPYRHEVSALGSETVCSYWQQGSCINQHCNLRHMEIKKNRKVIPCYWEKFPAGCKKPHCPFLHRLSRSNITNPIEPVKATPPSAKHANQEWTNRPDAKFDGNSTESEQGRGSSETGSFIGSPVVDPLIVNFDEESDSESAPSPMKSRRHRVSSCKTYEEIRLEEIQAESAAFYSYEQLQQQQRQDDLEFQEPGPFGTVDAWTLSPFKPPKEEMDFQVLSLDEIRKRRRRKQEEKAPGESQESEEYIKDTIKTIDQMRASIISRSLVERTKRGLAPEPEEQPAPKRLKGQAGSVATPPLKLRRNRIPALAAMTTTTTSLEQTVELKKLEDEAMDKTEERALDELDAEERETMEDEEDAEKMFEEISWKKQAVEVRLCDSSTDSHNQQSQDDILKDIDDLLKGSS